jgi:phage tail sheath gpL-like
MGKGDGDDRYLSVGEIRTLFVERRFPDRIVARLPKP